MATPAGGQPESAGGTPPRGATDAITFARPDQVKVAAGNAADGEDDFVVIAPELSLRYSAGLPSPVSYAIPAGIAQATQPRFVVRPDPLVVA